MSRILLSVLLLFGVLLYGNAEERKDTLTAARAFAELPVDVLDLLGKSTRLDMLDFYEADSIYDAANAMEGLSRLESVSPRRLVVELTPVSSLAVSVLDTGSGDVVMTAYTIGDDTQACDTDLRFFSSSYKELPREKYIKTASLDDFFLFPDKKTKKKVVELIPFPTVRYVPSADSETMTAELTVSRFMSADDYKEVSRYLKGKLLYRWDGKKFRLEK